MPPVDPDADARARFVQPFYLKMMRLNAIQYGPRLAADIVVAGRTASPADVISLLGSNWRERVMGAWFALLQADPSVTEAVLQALSTSHGSLDAPPLPAPAVTPPSAPPPRTSEALAARAEPPASTPR